MLEAAMGREAGGGQFWTWPLHPSTWHLLSATETGYRAGWIYVLTQYLEVLMSGIVAIIQSIKHRCMHPKMSISTATDFSLNRAG